MRSHWGEPLHQQARQILSQDFDEPTLITTQAYVLQATYHLSFGGTRKAVVCLSTFTTL